MKKAVITLIVVILTAISGTAAESAQAFCGGEIAGDDTSEVIHGSRCSDVIFAEGGNDVVYAHRGDDDVWGWRGRDEIHGGLGNDILRGGRANDEIFAQDNMIDIVIGGRGDNDFCQVDRFDVVKGCEVVGGIL